MSGEARSVAVIGAEGQLGRVIVRHFTGAGLTVHALSRRALDVTRPDAVATRLAALAPGIVINCAAFIDVDGAEDRQAEALAVNGLAVGSLARGAARLNAIFVHYGTDFVFPGTVDRPLTEDDPPEPRSVYAQSKLVGEWMAADCPRHYVLRVESLFGGTRRPGTIDRISAAMATGDEVRLFIDRTVSPSYVDDVAMATERLVRTAAPFGVYHCVNTGSATWFELGRTLAQKLGRSNARLVPVPVAAVPMRAPRPQFAALSNARLAAAGVQMPTWEDALDRYVERLRLRTAALSGAAPTRVDGET
jgi:dTDP-4-dehydrorhamnose reductase